MINMTNSEKKNILKFVYDIDIKMDEAIEKRDAAMSRNDEHCAAVCEQYHTNLSFQLNGIQNALHALGYKLVDDNGFWKIERRT